MEDKDEGVKMSYVELNEEQKIQVGEGKSVRNILIRFDDGEEDGRPVSRVYGFNVIKREGESALDILEAHLKKCLIMLDKHKTAENNAVESLESPEKSDT